MTRIRASAACMLLVAGALASACATAPSKPYERTTAKSVAETVEDLEFAITERNFRISARLHVGRGIRERDGGVFPEYEVLLFCNLGLTRRMLELDPGYINHCPARVAVRDQGGTTHISAPLLPLPAATNAELAMLARRINGLLQEIVDYGTESWNRIENAVAAEGIDP